MLSFRPLTTSDLTLLADWLVKPHVLKWWPQSATMAEVVKKYGPRIEGKDPTSMFVVQDGTVPIGIMQVYLLSSYPDHAKLYPVTTDSGIDYFIGDEAYLGRGVGSEMIGKFIEQVVKPQFPKATGISVNPRVDNKASIGALSKVGFKLGTIIQGEHGPEQLMRLVL